MIDDFLKHPEEARDVVGRAPAANWKHEKGGRNFVDYYDCRLRFPIRYPNGMIAAAQQAIREVYELNTRPSDASVDVNWFMQIHEKRADFAVPHNDMTDKVQPVFHLHRLLEPARGVLRRHRLLPLQEIGLARAR